MPPRFDSIPSAWSTELAATDAGPAPGKRSLTQRMVHTPAPPAAAVQRHLDPAAAAVQRAQQEHDLAAAFGFLGGPAASVEESLVQLATDTHTGLSDDAISAHAAAGVSGAGATLPHLDAIQRSFGEHDVSGVRAHVGGAAADASHAIGAHAYATGNDVAFAAQPDLFLAAHEAAHVVQQRQGVQLKGAVGQDGDAYERHADEVAATVVRGDSAAALLGDVLGAGAASAPVQRFSADVGTIGGGAVTIASKPSTIATTDGHAGAAHYRQTNVYNEEENAWLTIPEDYTGFVSLDWFGSADLNDGIVYDRGADLAVNAGSTVSFKNGVFATTEAKAKNDPLPACDVDFKSDAKWEVTDNTAPKLSVTVSFIPTGSKKSTNSDQYTAKGKGDTELTLGGKGVKAGGEVGYTKTKTDEITHAAPGALVRTYTLQLAFTKPRKPTAPPPTEDGGKDAGKARDVNIGPFIYQDNRQDNRQDNQQDNRDQSSTQDNRSYKDDNSDNSKDDHSSTSTSSKDDHSSTSTSSKDDHSSTTIVLPPGGGGGKTPDKPPTIPRELQNVRVYFAYGSASLHKASEQTGSTPEAQITAYLRLLDAYEDAYSEAGRDFENPWTLLKKHLFSVKFTGNASSSGGDAANTALSSRRARAFERAFLDKNFNDPADKGDRGVTRGDGESGASQDFDSPADRYAKIFWAAG